MYITAQEAGEESRMSDGKMADNRELMILFFNERCVPIYLEDELVAVQVGSAVMPKKYFDCSSCHNTYTTFLETPPKYCLEHAPRCEACNNPCPNGTIENLCVVCYKEEIS